MRNPHSNAQKASSEAWEDIKMKYWTRNANEYELNAPSVVVTQLILATIFTGLAVLVKVLNLHNAAFWFFAIFAGLGFLGFFMRKNQKVTINPTQKTFNTPKGGVLGAAHSFALKNFSRFQVNKVTYALIPIAVEVSIYFLNESGKEVRYQLGQKLYTNSTAWAQQLIDETEKIIRENA